MGPHLISYPPFLDLEPWRAGPFEFTTPLPGSKSLTLRDCAIAALAAGTSTIRYPGEADDYWRMKDCLRRLGIGVDDSQAEFVTIAGRGGEFAPGRVELDVGQSAVTTRLMLACAALRADVTVVDGHVSMRNRPNKDLVDALRALGATLESTNDGHLPTTVRGTRALRGPVRVPGTISSQFLTSLLTIAPLIEGGLSIEVEGELTSKPYVELTLDEMAKFGVRVENDHYRSAGRATAGVPGWQLRRRRRRVGGLVFRRARDTARRTNHAQQPGHAYPPGRLRLLRPVRKTGCFRAAASRFHPLVGPRRLDTAFDGDVDMSSMPDVAPTLMMLAPFLARPTRLHGPRDAARQGMRPHRRAHPRIAQGRRHGGGRAGLDAYRALAQVARGGARGSGNRDLSRSPHRHVLRCARIAPAGPADPRSGLRGQDLSELLARLAARRRRTEVGAGWRNWRK